MFVEGLACNQARGGDYPYHVSRHCYTNPRIRWKHGVWCTSGGLHECSVLSEEDRVRGADIFGDEKVYSEVLDQESLDRGWWGFHGLELMTTHKYHGNEAWG